jgi:1-acyl-sn-glycerol-3-phosphate acyltransferase
MAKSTSEFRYPRRRLLRAIMRPLSRLAFAVLTDFHIEGQENFPEKGPLIVVFNHFSFIDPVVLVRVLPWPPEFIGGFVNPGAPPIVTWIPRVWGFYPVFRGTGSRLALRASEAVLNQGGILGIAPEAGSWATVLRPARPGAAYVATRTGAPLLPMGLDGLPDVFPEINKGRRARVTVRIGKPFGPFGVTGRGRERREQLDEVGHTIMRKIKELIPPEKHGYYSDDPAIREAAKGTEIYPWDTATETDFHAGEHLE